jgi:hypothetical protein
MRGLSIFNCPRIRIFALPSDPRGDPIWVPSDRWFHRSHLNAVMWEGLGWVELRVMQFRERKRKELRARNPWGYGGYYWLGYC